MTLAPSSAFVLGKESCLLTLNYAWYHLIFCTLQAAGLWWAGRTQHFALAHSFALFAVLMDYGLGYLVQGTRTVSYLGHMDDGVEPLGPLGVFLFFMWFDYAAFGLVVWALDVEDRLRCAFEQGLAAALGRMTTSRTDLFFLAIAPLQFWTAPWLSSSLALDNRALLLSRESPKMLYVVAVPSFVAVLHFAAGIGTWDIAAVLLSGLGCGCVHHLALFVFGMRGYSGFAALALTLLTEWPALITGLAVLRRLGHSLVGLLIPSSLSSRVRGTTVFNLAMWAGLLSILCPRLAEISRDDAVTYLIPYVPGEYMQSVGTGYLRARTCVGPSLGLGGPTLDCWDRSAHGDQNNGSDLLVMASAAKAGAVLSARIVAEVGSACGLCVASPERSRAGIPGPVEMLPSYRGQILLAVINMMNWPEYAVSMGYSDPRRELQPRASLPSTSGSTRGRVRCVTTLRDPLARLTSLYLYARSGGEAWFRYQTGIMQRLQETGRRSLEASLLYFWDAFAQAYLEQSHVYMLFNLQLGCTPVTMEAFQHDFDGSIATVLRAWGVQEGALPVLTWRLKLADLGQKTEAQREADPHVASKKFSPELVKAVPAALMQMNPVRTMVELQRRQLASLEWKGGSWSKP